MSTRSTIALEFADGTVQQVYCHSDGYLEGVGDRLRRSFTNPFALRDLIDLGDMSYIGAPYSLRGDNYPANKFQNLNDYFLNCQQEEYDYILRNIDGSPVWYVRCWATKGAWVPFNRAVAMIDQQRAQEY